MIFIRNLLIAGIVLGVIPWGALLTIIVNNQWGVIGLIVQGVGAICVFAALLILINR